MPLVVPVLRLFIVFLNVYETFKTLKFPSPKRRGQPSIRSLTQRKRDLKGCLAIWIVWASTRLGAFELVLSLHLCSAVMQHTRGLSIEYLVFLYRSTAR